MRGIESYRADVSQMSWEQLVELKRITISEMGTQAARDLGRHALTVGDLRRAIQELPEDMPILINLPASLPGAGSAEGTIPLNLMKAEVEWFQGIPALLGLTASETNSELGRIIYVDPLG